jgi:hypothetical protein
MATELMMTLKEADRLAVVKRIETKELNFASILITALAYFH